MRAEGFRQRSRVQIEALKRELDDLLAMVERGERCDVPLARLAEIETELTRLAHMLAGAYSMECQLRHPPEETRDELARTLRLLERGEMREAVEGVTASEITTAPHAEHAGGVS
jgi:hypothetical protein